MMHLDLSDITKVIETPSSNEVNEFLSQGWKLINTYTTSLSYESSDQTLIYVLGKEED